ncbi:MAG: sugar isomerase, partial [Deinococcus sp.]
SRDPSLWFADGTNYAGQDDLRARKHRMRAALKRVHDALPEESRMLVEYKLFEPAFYATDLFDWGSAYVHCLAAGEKAQVLVDLGHHAQGVNIEQIVAFLLDEGRLGGFHFNARRYADDDLIVGTSNPFELFCIYAELVGAARSDDERVRRAAAGVAYMIDQSHNIEPKVEAMLFSVLNCQEAYAKALLVDRDLLREAQAQGDVLGAHRVLTDAFRTDVRGLLADWRAANGLPDDPIRAHRESGYQERVARERGTQSGGGGYPVKEQAQVSS